MMRSRYSKLWPGGDQQGQYICCTVIVPLKSLVLPHKKNRQTKNLLSATCVIGENIAQEAAIDAESLKVAYLAYKFNRATVGSDFSLNGLTQYDDDQLFFLSAAKSLCENGAKSEDSFKSNPAGLTYFPAELRLRIALENFPKFAQYFKCNISDGKAPTKQICEIWSNFNSTQTLLNDFVLRYFYSSNNHEYLQNISVFFKCGVVGA